MTQSPRSLNMQWEGFTKNNLADDLLWQIETAGLPAPEREIRFHPTRRWRIDLGYPNLKLGFECEGGIWTRGRHTRGQGFINDCEKYAAAWFEGWSILRLPAPWIESGEALEIVSRAYRKAVENAEKQ